MVSLQSDKYIHTMNKGINSLYFSPNITDTPYGYQFFSKRSKIKDKMIVYDGYTPPQFVGELIKSTASVGYTKSTEIIYHLPTLFNRELYDNRKKYQNRVLSPRVLAGKLKLNVRVATFDDLPAIDKLHTEWVTFKMSDPKVHKHSMSTARYIRCMQNSINVDGFIAIVIEQDGVIVGARAVSIYQDVLFDAAFFVAFWNQSQLSEAANIISLDFFINLGYSYLNTGIATGSLKKYKQHFPHTEVYVYRTITRDAPEVNLDAFFEE